MSISTSKWVNDWCPDVMKNHSFADLQRTTKSLQLKLHNLKFFSSLQITAFLTSKTPLITTPSRPYHVVNVANNASSFSN